MYKQLKDYGVVALLSLLFISSFPAMLRAQEKPKEKGESPTGTPVLWRDPGDISTRDLLAGPGGEEKKPELSSISFVKEETGGYSPKFRVSDGAGKVWVAKL